jgi:hypothetical protein
MLWAWVQERFWHWLSLAVWYSLRPMWPDGEGWRWDAYLWVLAHGYGAEDNMMYYRNIVPRQDADGVWRLHDGTLWERG